jgi:hypothetical protein
VLKGERTNEEEQEEEGAAVGLGDAAGGANAEDGVDIKDDIGAGEVNAETGGRGGGR